MHMADALISPAVGVTMLTVTAGSAAYSIKKVQDSLDNKKIPLMGVMGAFVFAAQMINFSIPGTGSSGHLGGGVLLASMLGPYAGFLTMASILLIQALFFADGGLLAYGCNVFNLGFFSCFILYPFIFRRITRKGITPRRIFAASMLSAVLGLQMGAFSVVLETFLSGKAIELPFRAFALSMQSIHLAIGIVEGLVTSAIVTFVWKARPEILESTAGSRPISRNVRIGKVLVVFAVAAVLTGGVLSWFASASPDGLEWSLLKAVGDTGIKASDRVHDELSKIQEKTSIFSDYNIKSSSGSAAVSTKNENSKPAADAGKSIAGLAGGAMTLALAGLTAFFINFAKKRRKIRPGAEV